MYDIPAIKSQSTLKVKVKKVSGIWEGAAVEAQFHLFET